MTTKLHTLSAILSAAGLLAAQDQPTKPVEPASATKPAKPAKDKPADDKVPGDDPVTKKDAAIAAIDAMLQKAAIDRSVSDWRSRLTAPTKQKFDAKFDYLWHLETNKGEITVKLLPATAPMHVTNAIYLTRCGFYDGLKFHRVIRGFMAQGGCPFGRGNGTPGYQFDGEFDPKVKHDKPGLVSTANSGPGTDGSQFFLTFVPTPHLDGKHTIYGEIIAGKEALKALEAAGGDQSGKTSEPLMLQRAWIQVVDPSAAPGAKPDAGKDASKDAGADAGKDAGKDAGGKKTDK